MNNPMLYTDPSAMSWFSDLWDGMWDGLNNFAEWADETDWFPSSGGINVNVDNNGTWGYNTNVNGQETFNSRTNYDYDGLANYAGSHGISNMYIPKKTGGAYVDPNSVSTNWAIAGDPQILDSFDDNLNVIPYSYLDNLLTNDFHQRFSGRAEVIYPEQELAELIYTLGGATAIRYAFKKSAKFALKYTDNIATKFGGRAAARSGKAIVLGEGMGAVKTTVKTLQSQGINAKWYQAWSKNFPVGRQMTSSELNAALARNQRWLNTKINQGYKIYDIGIDPKRIYRSPFYELEQSILQKTGYPVTKLPR